MHKEQKYVSHNTGVWEVQDQGADRSSSLMRAEGSEVSDAVPLMEKGKVQVTECHKVGFSLTPSFITRSCVPHEEIFIQVYPVLRPHSTSVSPFLLFNSCQPHCFLRIAMSFTYFWLHTYIFMYVCMYITSGLHV